MSDKPIQPLKTLSAQEWETLIEDFQYGGPRCHKWTSQYSIPSLVDLLLFSILRKELSISLKIQLLLFLEEFSDLFFTIHQNTLLLDRLLDSLRAVIQAPSDGVHITLQFKEQIMVSTTSILISIEAFELYESKYVCSLVELLLNVINRPNFGLDRQTRAIACECLRELEKSYPGLLSEVVGHLWGLCQNERTHASQGYILLFTTVIYNIMELKLNVSILNTAVPLVPFTVPQLLSGTNLSKEISSVNYKELRKAMAFLLESSQVLTPCGMVEFMTMIMPVAVALELQPSMLKVQFFGLMYSYDPMLCHLVLKMYLHFLDAFDGQEGNVSSRLMLISRESQHILVFRLLALHWLLGFSQLINNRDVAKTQSIVDLNSNFYPNVFDPLALKALKLDLLAFCSVLIEKLRNSHEDVSPIMVKLFKDGLVSVSAFKWLPPGSTETTVAFRAFHRFLMGASSHSENDPSTARALMESAIFQTIQEMLVDMVVEYRRLVPVIVAFIDRLLGCQKHCWLGERFLQTLDERLLPKLKMDYKLISCFLMFDRIAGNDTIPPSALLEVLAKFMFFLVEKHGPDTGLKSWSQGSRVLGVCRIMLLHHRSSKLFLRLSHLLAFTCLYFPDLEVRDNARIYLRMLISIPGKKLREILDLGQNFLGISPASHSSSFFNVQSPRLSQKLKKYRNISSCVHLERDTPLLVKQSWSLALCNLGMSSSEQPAFVDGIMDREVLVEERDVEESTNIIIVPETAKVDMRQDPLRVMDSKIAEILSILREYFSCIPDFRHMPGIKVRIICSLRFDSRKFIQMLGVESPTGPLGGIDALPAIYATVLKFSSPAPYGLIKSCHIPFLLGEPPTADDISSEGTSLSIVPIENNAREYENFRAPVLIELEPREPSPGLIDAYIETNAENGQIIQGQLHGVSVGIEDMFLRPNVPSDMPADAVPHYNFDLFGALWEACGASSNIGRETFPLNGGKGVTAINGTRSVKLLEIPAPLFVRATERHLAPFVVGVIGEPLVDVLRDGGVIRDVIWKNTSDASEASISVTDLDRGPLCLTYNDDDTEKGCLSTIGKRNLGCLFVLIFLPPRFHLLFQMEVSDHSTLARIRTDYWPCLAYIDDYLEALYLA